MFSCFLCDSQFVQSSHLLIHLNIFHNSKSIKEFKCKQPNCFRIFGSLDSFKKHINSHPLISIKNNIIIDQEMNVDNYPPILTNSTIPSNFSVICEPLEEIDPSFSAQDSLNEKKIQKNVINLVSKWYCNSAIPRNMVQTLLDDVQHFNNSILIDVKTKINCIVNNPNSANIVKDLSLVLNALETLSNPFDNLKTEYFRLQSLEDLGLLIRPKQIVIGFKLNDHLQDGVVVLDSKPVNIVLTPLRFVLKQLFEHSNFFDIILKYTKELLAYDGKVIYSFVQSQLWKDKLSLHENKIVFPLFLYFDDLGINNPLGSHAGNQKLEAVYISLACLPPELSSSLDHIFLASLFKTDYKKQYGNKKIFKDLISELNYLETVGIDIIVNNENFKNFFSIGLILGDNLGIHSILGFVESFVARYPCRFCKSSKFECQQQLLQNDIILRNSFNYDNDVAINNVSQTGIKEKCIWNDLNFFRATENYSVDIMHDMLEGVCKYDIGLILKYMVFDFKYFTVEIFNNRIETFNYSPIDIRNRPTLISAENLKHGVIKMSAAESLCLTRYLGLIIGDLVPVNSEFLSLYIVLKQIVDIIFQKCIRLKDTILLKCLISEH